MGTSFVEIEHKFIVPSDYSRAEFMKKARAKGALRVDEVKVNDTYYVLKGWKTHLFRHRFDKQIQQLTVKSVGASTFERLEINLNLLQDGIDQTAAVQGFLSVFGIAWHASIAKDIGVAYFEDCEIVHYHAGTVSRKISCVEFEAVGFSDGQAALPTLNQYEHYFGFDAKTAENRNLFQLLLLDDAPPEIQALFLK